jgi:acyl-CoA-binding protein
MDAAQGAAQQQPQDDTFHAAADHVGVLVSGDPLRVPDQVKLQLYGLYKQATVGQCSAPKPAFWHRAARLKWCAQERCACRRDAPGSGSNPPSLCCSSQRRRATRLCTAGAGCHLHVCVACGQYMT